jgi:cadmium resistance protein CadD (predicted permease)
MTNLMLALLPLTIAAALQPLQVFAMISLMKGRRSVANGLAYISGMTAFRLALGALFWVLLSSVEEAIESGGGKFGLVVGIVLVVLGVALLFYGLRYGISANEGEETAPTWLKKLGDASPAKAGLIGIAMLALDPKDWLVDLAAVDMVAAADLSGLASLLAYLWYALLSMTLVFIPLILVLVAPQKGTESLDSLNAWLERYARTIVIAVAVLLGGYFLFTGLEMLGVIS